MVAVTTAESPILHAGESAEWRRAGEQVDGCECSSKSLWAITICL